MRSTDNPTLYRQELKGKIRSVAISEFIHRGIRAVKMDDIARHLSISKRTLYEVFANKEQLLFEVLKTLQQEREDEMRAFASDPNHNTIDIIMKFYQMQMDHIKNIPTNFLIEVEKFPRAMEFFNEQQKQRDSKALSFFKRGISEGFFRSDVDYQLIAEVGKGYMQTVMKEQLYERYPIDHIFRNIIFLFVRGFCTQKGLDQLDNILKNQSL
ncbi:MAG: TetR/AcrR family transcriptional regulator [Prevotella sp.]|nr:TetR/AcrR family transcriptional regulator [Prevotella sp.]